MELESLDQSNRALQQQIWAIGDMRSALEQAADAESARARALEAAYNDARQATDDALQQARQAIDAARKGAAEALQAQFDAQQAVIQAQIETATLARDTAREQVASITRVFETIRDQVNELRGVAGLSMTAAQGRAFLEQAIATARSTGYLPELDALSGAISAARGGLDSRNFRTSTDLRRAQARLAITLEDLGQVAGDQLDAAQSQLDAQEASLQALESLLEQGKAQFDRALAANEAFYDAQLAAAQAQVDELRGVNSSVLSVAGAMDRLALSLQAESAARTAAVSAASSAAAPRAAISPEQIVAQYRASVGVGAMTEAQFVAAARVAGISDSQLLSARDLLLGQAPRFASGAAFNYGVVQRPSAFPLGIMGEAGPEAIMPLSRGPNGALGVRSFGNEALVAEMQALRNELEGLRAEARATASHTAKTARILDRVTPDGNSLQTVAAP